MSEEPFEYNAHLLDQAAHELIEGRAPPELEEACREIWGPVEPLHTPPAPTLMMPPLPAKETVREVREVRVEKAPRKLIALVLIVGIILAGLAAAQIILTLRPELVEPSKLSAKDFKKHAQASTARHDDIEQTLGKKIDDHDQRANANAEEIKTDGRQRFTAVDRKLVDIEGRIRDLSGKDLMNDKQVERLALMLELKRIERDLVRAEKRYTEMHPTRARLMGRYSALLKKLGMKRPVPETPAPKKTPEPAPKAPTPPKAPVPAAPTPETPPVPEDAASG